MGSKFHINNDHEVRICFAVVNDCQFKGDNDHHTDRKDAEKESEKRLKKEAGGLFGIFKAKKRAKKVNAAHEEAIGIHEDRTAAIKKKKADDMAEMVRIGYTAGRDADAAKMAENAKLGLVPDLSRVMYEPFDNRVNYISEDIQHKNRAAMFEDIKKDLHLTDQDIHDELAARGDSFSDQLNNEQSAADDEDELVRKHEERLRAEKNDKDLQDFKNSLNAEKAAADEEDEMVRKHEAELASKAESKKASSGIPPRPVRPDFMGERKPSDSTINSNGSLPVRPVRPVRIASENIDKILKKSDSGDLSNEQQENLNRIFKENNEDPFKDSSEIHEELRKKHNFRSSGDNQHDEEQEAADAEDRLVKEFEERKRIKRESGR